MVLGRVALLPIALLAVSACGGSNDKQPAKPPATDPAEVVATTEEAPAPTQTIPPVTEDRFTNANYNEVRVSHADLDLNVEFAKKIIDGVATLSFDRIDPAAAELDLDTNGLDIKSVEAGHGGKFAPVKFTLGEADPVRGAKLSIALPQDADKVRIAYRTNPNAAGLQWLDAAQTAGKEHPFMYSQNQSINARSMAPLQDTPEIRMTYSAHVTTPPELRAIMSAAQDDGPVDGDYQFDMPQKIAPYLLAIAVGDIAFKPINDTIGVYAEPSVADAAANEFADTPEMEKAVSALYGPYRWGRYDILVLPPSFPFGGMENPRLTFLTPTLIVGDKSLTGTVAHELAHSWSGNLVTNATWSDAWLNEGVTTYVENRIVEDVYGEERATMELSLSLEGLKEEIADLDDPKMTRLQLPADLKDPDDGFSSVAYDKGALFLKFLEGRYGREVFDPFLKSYFENFAFKAVTTADFRTYLFDNLVEKHPGKATPAEIDEWLFGEGLPATTPHPVSHLFEKVDAEQARWLASPGSAGKIKSAEWSTQEWLHFINTLPADISSEQMKDLDIALDLSNSPNAEIAFAWYRKSIKANYRPALPAVEGFLTRVGRGKFIYPLYEELKENGEAAFAERVFEKSKLYYHPIAVDRIEKILQSAN
ncbi:MAG: M1 family metallopeptidase [Parvularculaceae bacterium]